MNGVVRGVHRSYSVEFNLALFHLLITLGLLVKLWILCTINPDATELVDLPNPFQFFIVKVKELQ